MPLAFLAIGALFLVAAVRDTLVTKGDQPGLLTLLKGDLTGPNNFGFWLVAIGVIGSIGYIPGFKPVANAFLFLFCLVLIIANRGFFTKFAEQLNATAISTPPANSINPLTDPSLNLGLIQEL